LKKHYSGRLPKLELPVLETMLFAACLENATHDEALAALDELNASFHDLNEVRVSSVKETERAFANLSDPDWRALRVRSVLQYVFEDTYSFEFEGLRRKTLDSAVKQLAKISHMTPFMRSFTLQQCLGSHLLPVDDRMANVLIWLGLSEVGSSTQTVSDHLKSAVRKSEAPLFCHTVRCLATDPKYTKLFDKVSAQTDPDAYDLNTAVERLDRLFKRGVSAFVRPKKKVAKKSAKKSTSSKKSTKKTKSGKTSSPRKKVGKKKVKVAKPKRKTVKKKRATSTKAAKKTSTKTKKKTKR